MKKKLNQIIVLAGLLLSLYSCREDHFDILPQHQGVPSTIFTTELSYRQATDGAYDALKEGYTGDTGNILVVGDALADNVILNPLGRQTNKSAYDWSFSPEDYSVTGLYSSMYLAISRANLVLDNLSNIPYTDFMKNIEAEAKGIRALAHFEIVRAYAKIPTQSADAKNSLGIAYVTTYDPGIKIDRDITVETTYNKILSDLLFALDNINDNNNVGRLNKAAIAGYLSKVYLYLGNYDKAIQYGEKSIEISPSVGTKDNFTEIWTDSSTDGLLFTLQNANVSKDNGNVGTGYNQNIQGITSEFTADYGLYKKYSDSDVRKKAYLLTANTGKTPYNHIIKYRTRKGSNVAGVVNVKLLRTADIYLTVAEAHLKSSTVNEAKALDLLNTLRAQRYDNFANGTESGNNLLNAILLERRLELAFENDRFWTIKRLGENVERSDYGSAVDGTGTDAPSGDTKILPASSHRFVLPIPISAIRINPSLKQNPKY